VLVDLVRDAWRQYRQRPLAAVLLLVVTGIPLALEMLPEPARVTVSVLLFPIGFVAGILVSLFLVPYLGGVINPAWPGRRQAWRATWRMVGPGLRAYFLWLAYAAVAIMAGVIIASALVDPGALRAASPPAAGAPPSDDQVRFLILMLTGIAPLIAFATAFLTTLQQRVLLDGERRALAAAVLSHRIARRNFPICLLIALLTMIRIPVEAAQLPITVRLGLGALATLLMPFTVGMANALYARERDPALASLEEASRPRS
jgi:hypothetical protein